MVRNLSTLFLPVTVLLFSCWSLSRVPTLSTTHQELLAIAPYLLAIVAVASAYHFKRGRTCLVLLLSTSFYYYASHYGAQGLETPESFLVYHGFAVLLPFNLLIISLMSEKGIIGSAGRMRMAFVLFQLLIFWITFHQRSQTMWAALTRPIIQSRLFEVYQLPQISLLLLLLAVGVIVARAWQRQSPLDGAFFGAALAFGLLLAQPDTPYIAPVFNSAIGLIFILAIIQDSHNMAFRDDMTGLPSRRALNELLRGLGSSYAIAMVDVDHFKRFNDTYGHDVGDQVLKVVASRLMAVTGGGRPFRYGGEEFTVIFPGKTAKDAAPHLEKLRKAIEEYKMALRSDERPKDDSKGQVARAKPYGSRDVSVTVSIGVAESGGRYASAEEVIKASDTALYRAKNGGRNQVCVAGQR
ncbi:diguanylate cyclase (GGDEF) domain-containing protein [Trichlorobacter thiogenes]|uniref:diguanylate cyclase n=1 Tax=Trichlorobacter thiogenes TaxID=115783 RepID=A0A1T4RVZ1_9BACT|nr:GGDEF domain-containing protein [Trichlorobacter thiogenes]SKA20132.1 diguanylate cyclase (GGDEF) domain-containing protein [Trichlorobacter thiogenes]